jgi:arsenate reductase
MSVSYNVLFVCYGNACRSIMAEAILRKLGAGRFQVFSAGCHPAGQVNPLALQALARRGYPTAGLYSKAWDAFTAEPGVALDFVITVCDLAALANRPERVHAPVDLWWNFPAPGALPGSDQEIRVMVETVCQHLEQALKKFVLLPIDRLDQKERSSLAHCVPVQLR